MNGKPSLNPNVDDIADWAKHWFAHGTSDLATLQYRLGELAGSGKLDREESMRLQECAVSIWEALYEGTLCAVRDQDAPDSTWDEADNTYSDGRPVLVQVRIEPVEHSDLAWEHNAFTLGDGAIAERPMGTIYCINPIKPPDSSPGPTSAIGQF